MDSEESDVEKSEDAGDRAYKDSDADPSDGNTTDEDMPELILVL